ncbi:MAG: hypothetical protein RBT71_04280, partial [Flavobacteriales bacterium]|nr:hypothetical protein [Flavobacteriales bacterium]
MHTSNTFRRNLLTAALVLGAGSLWQAAAQSVAIDPAWAIGNELVRFPQGPGESLTTEPLPTSYNPGVPDAYEYQGQVAQRTQNVQYDAEGNVQFFIVDDQVFNGDGLLIADAAADPFDRDCEACFFGGDEVHVIPVPGSCTRYYVVS